MTKETRAPVIVFAYNRPDHLTRTLTALAAAEGARATELWIFCDGPKPAEPRARIDVVHKVADAPDWRAQFAAVQVVKAPQNKGLARSVIDGVSEVVARFGQVIVLEDDLLVAPDFLDFMNACLAFYRADQTIGSVTGFCPLPAVPDAYPHDVMALPRNCSHGWATWSDRWAEVDWSMSEAQRVLHDRALRRKLDAAGTDRAFRLRQQLRGRVNSWSIAFGLWHVLTDRATIYPVENRVKNIGFDGSGVHTRAGQEVNAALAETPRAFRLEHVAPDPNLVRAVRKVYSGSRHGQMRRQTILTLEALIGRNAHGH
ncbi:MAG: glycosyltransferase [Pseudomonadota bacterium]